MYLKRLFAAEVFVSPLSMLRRTADGCLLAFCTAAAFLNAAHAAPIQIHIEPQRLFNWSYGGISGTNFYPTAAEAFAEFKSFPQYEGCAGNPVTCHTSLKLEAV